MITSKQDKKYIGCPFCGKDPFYYADEKTKLQIAGADCCEWGWYLYDGGERNNHNGIEYKEVLAMRKREEENREEKGIGIY